MSLVAARRSGIPLLLGTPSREVAQPTEVVTHTPFNQHSHNLSIACSRSSHHLLAKERFFYSLTLCLALEIQLFLVGKVGKRHQPFTHVPQPTLLLCLIKTPGSSHATAAKMHLCFPASFNFQIKQIYLARFLRGVADSIKVQ